MSVIPLHKNEVSVMVPRTSVDGADALVLNLSYSERSLSKSERVALAQRRGVKVSTIPADAVVRSGFKWSTFHVAGTTDAEITFGDETETETAEVNARGMMVTREPNEPIHTAVFGDMGALGLAQGHAIHLHEIPRDRKVTDADGTVTREPIEPAYRGTFSCYSSNGSEYVGTITAVPYSATDLSLTVRVQPAVK